MWCGIYIPAKTNPEETINEETANNSFVSSSYSKIVPVYNNTDEIVEDAKVNATEFLNLKKNDVIVITGGFPNNTATKKTNFMKIEEI